VDNFWEGLKPFVARFVAAALTGVIVYLMQKLGIGVSDTTKENVDAFMLFMSLSIYSGIHRGLSKMTNPQDEATSPVSDVGAEEAKEVAAHAKSRRRKPKSS